MKLLIQIFTAILIGSSCNDSRHYFDKICDGNTAFKFDSTRRSPSHANFENNKYLTIRQIGIPSDTFYLRIEGGSTGNNLKIFEYSFYKDEESFKIYEFQIRPDGYIDFDKGKDKLKDFETIFDPTAKGKHFIEELEKNQILRLPNSEEIPNYPPVDEMSSPIIIEYSNQCRYNIVWFYDINRPQAKKIKEARTLSNFLTYLKNEFGY